MQIIRIFSAAVESYTCIKYLTRTLSTLLFMVIRWKIKMKEAKSTQVTFTLDWGYCSLVFINNSIIPTETSLHYLGLLLDKILTWNLHTHLKRMEIKTLPAAPSITRYLLKTTTLHQTSYIQPNLKPLMVLRNRAMGLHQTFQSLSLAIFYKPRFSESFLTNHFKSRTP